MAKIVLIFSNEKYENAILELVNNFKLTDFINDELDLKDLNAIDQNLSIDGEGNTIVTYEPQKEDIEPTEDDLEDIEDVENNNINDD